MICFGREAKVAALLLSATGVLSFTMPAIAEEHVSADTQARSEHRIELGRRMYMEGILPSGKMMNATVRGDIRLTGEQVICGSCHRRSGMGSAEGQEVVPAVTGALLFRSCEKITS